MSRSSRFLMSARTSASAAGRPVATYSRARRPARTSGLAVTKIFTSAFGQMTVPMSRPSSTAPGGVAANWRWKASRASRTGGNRRDYRGRLAHSRAFEGFFIEIGWIERLGRGYSGGGIIRPAAGIEHGFGHRPVQQPGVEMAQAVMSGELLAERALAGGGGTVDGDDHAKSAPRERISSTKPGKLVAMKAESSIRTGFSLASPMTSADMAMR